MGSILGVSDSLSLSRPIVSNTMAIECGGMGGCWVGEIEKPTATATGRRRLARAVRLGFGFGFGDDSQSLSVSLAQPCVKM